MCCSTVAYIQTPKQTDYSRTINNWFSLTSRCTNRKCKICYKTQNNEESCNTTRTMINCSSYFPCNYATYLSRDHRVGFSENIEAILYDDLPAQSVHEEWGQEMKAEHRPTIWISLNHREMSCCML